MNASTVQSVDWQENNEGSVDLDLEAMDLDSLGVKLKSLFLVGQEFLDIFALVSLELNHLTHLSIGHDGSIASCAE